MAKFRFKMNHGSGGIQAILNGAQGMDTALERVAEEKASRARSSAPVKSGVYRDSIHVETVHTDRVKKRVIADVPYAAKVEADTGNLGRTL
jgi:hypothetical protein